MKFLIAGVLLLTVQLHTVRCACIVSDWSQSFKKGGLSIGYNFIRGFVISGNVQQVNRDIGLLEGAECCTPPTPWHSSQLQTLHADWWASFDSQRLVECPVGFFLSGLLRTDSGARLNNIEEGRCSKPVDHPRQYKDCYLENIRDCISGKGTCRCRENYFVAGLGREACNDLNCMTILKCCQMMDRPEALDGTDKVKTMIMDKTLPDLALLAYCLGYGWAGGCREPYVGEGYLREGDTWVADKSSRCEGYMSDHRLSIAYGDWEFEQKSLTYGEPILQTLEPEVVKASVVYNNESAPTTKTVTVERTVIREVKAIKTTYWRDFHKLGLSLRYRNPKVAGSVDYTFSSEKSSTTYNSNNEQDKVKLTVTMDKLIQPFSASKWRAHLFKTKTVIPYTATIGVRFSVQLLGFLRWGGGYNGMNTNYHVQYRGDDRRVTFNYKFGHQNVSFYTDLSEQSSRHSPPWQWFQLFNKYPYLNGLIGHLTKESHYEFNVTGRFEDVMGTRLDIIWEPATLKKRETFTGSPRYQVFSGEQIAKSGPRDPPAVNEVITETTLGTSTLEELKAPVEIPTSA